MKALREKLTILVIAVITVAFVLPALSMGAAVPWSTEQYTATANGNIQYGPPLPTSTSFSGSGFLSSNNSSSAITSTYMDVSAYSHNLDYTVWGIASFTGTYVASSASPLFQFTYDGYYSTPTDIGFISEHFAWLRVDDLTTGTNLYDYSLLSLDNTIHTINVSTLSGHEISVNFGAQVTASRNFNDQSEHVKLNYSMAVVPEPISLTLFIVGGATLGFRRFREKFKKWIII